MGAALLAPLIVAVVGVLLYTATANAKVSEIGRIAYFVGLFWLVAALARSTHLLGG